MNHSTLPSPQCSPMQDTAAGGRVEYEALELPRKPGEDSRLQPGKQASDSDSITKEKTVGFNRANRLQIQTA